MCVRKERKFHENDIDPRFPFYPQTKINIRLSFIFIRTREIAAHNAITYAFFGTREKQKEIQVAVAEREHEE